MFVHKSLESLGGNFHVYLVNADLHENILYIGAIQIEIFIDVVEEVLWDGGVLTVKCLLSDLCCIAGVL